MSPKALRIAWRAAMAFGVALIAVACISPSRAYALDWTSFRGNAQNNGALTSTVKYPVNTGDASITWTYDATWYASATSNTGGMLMTRSNTLVVGNYIYFVGADYPSSTQTTTSCVYLYKLSKSTGRAAYSAGRVKLDDMALDYYASIAYSDGIIYVTSKNHTIGAYNASDGSKAWVQQYTLACNNASSQRIYTPITATDDYLYFGTMYLGSSSPTSGAYLCVRKSDGAKVWEYDNASSGYYWTGAGVKKLSDTDNAILFADDKGVVISADENASASAGAIVKIGTLAIGGSPTVRSSVVLDSDAAGACNALISDGSGRLDIITVNADGSFSGSPKRVAFCSSSNSTPAVLDGYAYVGGVQANRDGVLAAINISTAAVAQTATVDASSVASGYGTMSVTSSPLVIKTATKTVAYFLANNKPGTLYSMTRGSSQTAAVAVYTPLPDAQQYCIDSAVTDGEGNVFFSNDSSTFFAVKRSTDWIGLGGDTRYDTMQLIVDEGFAAASTVIVASGENYPDALAASALAGALDAPVILTDPSTLSVQAASEISALGATKAIIVGGDKAVSNAVMASLRSTGSIKSVARISGSDRYDTARQIYSQGKDSAGAAFSQTTCIIATGQDFPDSLSISPYAYAYKVPIFLAGGNGKLDTATASLIMSSGFTKVIFVGGAARISDSIKDQLGASLAYTRLAGDDRYLTSNAIAGWTAGKVASGSGIGFSAASAAGVASFAMVGVTTGKKSPDALAGAALIGKNKGVLLLVDPGANDGGVCTATGGLLDKYGAEMESGYFFGGISAVSDSIRAQCRNDTL